VYDARGEHDRAQVASSQAVELARDDFTSALARFAMPSGTLGPEELTYLSLHPQRIEILFADGGSRPAPEYGGLGAGMLWLLAARAADAEGDQARARECASQSVRTLCPILSEAQERGLADHARPSYGTGDSRVGCPLGPLHFTWGGYDNQFVLARRVACVVEAAELSGDPSILALAEPLRIEVERLEEAGKDGRRVGVYWTSAEALNRVPT